MNLTGKVSALAMVLLLITSGVGSMAAVADDGSLNHGADEVPDPHVTATVEKANHEMGWSATEYENDNGEVDELPAEVNSSVDNPFSYSASSVNFSDAGVFPTAKSSVSALDAGEWTVDESSTAGTMSVANTETAPNVDAVNVATSSQTSGDTAIATFANFSVTSDEEKRHVQLVADINTLDSGTTAEVRIVDADGDYKAAEINSSRSTGNDLIANSTATGVVYQEQLGNLETQGSGDGTFDDMAEVNVVVMDGDLDAEFSAVNAEKMSEWDFGTQMKDTDSDDDLEEVEITETKTGGDIQVSSLDSLGPAFDSAAIKNLNVEIEASASELSSGDTKVQTNETDAYPSYSGTATISYRLSLPDAYDLSYSNVALDDKQLVVNDRILSVEYAEATGDTAFSDISSWTDKTDLYTGEGNEMTIDSTVQPGQSLVLQYEFRYTESELDNVESSGVAGGPTGKSAGGLGDIPLIGGLLATIYLGIRKLGGS